VGTRSGRIRVESPGYDKINFPGSHFHMVLPLTKREESSTNPIANVVIIKME